MNQPEAPTKPTAHLRDRLVVVLTWVLAFGIPIVSKGIQIPIILLSIAWLIAPKPAFRQNIWPILIFTGLYLFHIVGLLYTENMDRGAQDMMQKLSLLLFPLIYGSFRAFSSRERFYTLLAFAAGTVVAIGVGVVSSYLDYRETGDVLSFYMSRFSPAHHPSYIAMYINFAAALLIISVYNKLFSGKWRYVAFGLALFFALSLFMPSSKLGSITFVALLPFLLYMAWRKGQLKSWNTAWVLAIWAIYFTVSTVEPMTEERFGSTVEIAVEGAEVHEEESTRARIIAWTIAAEETIKHPFGVGTGDISETMIGRYREGGFDKLADKDLNPHNNYLQISVALGIPALLVFLFSLLYAFRQTVRRSDWVYAFFLMSIAMNFGVESMLEKQSGVVYFAFFNALLFFSATEMSHTSAKRELS